MQAGCQAATRLPSEWPFANLTAQRYAPQFALHRVSSNGTAARNAPAGAAHCALPVKSKTKCTCTHRLAAMRHAMHNPFQ